MLKIEYVWRELLDQAIEHKNPYFTLTQLGLKLHLSTSMINHALIPLKSLNIVQIHKTRSKIVNWEKLLFFWATRRNLKKDIIYTTYSDLSVLKREGYMPSEVIPTVYSAYKRLFKNTPADYDHVYFYAENSSSVQERFPPSKKNPNMFILQPDPFLLDAKQISLGQLFVDFWNVPEWYAKDFSDKLMEKIRNKIEL